MNTFTHILAPFALLCKFLLSFHASEGLVKIPGPQRRPTRREQRWMQNRQELRLWMLTSVSTLLALLASSN